MAPSGRRPSIAPEPLLLPRRGPGRRALLLSVALGAAAAALVVCQAVVLALAIDAVFLAGRSLRDVAGHLVGLAALAVARAGLIWQSDAAAARAAAAVRVHLRRKAVGHLYAAGPALAASHPAGALSGIVTGGVEATDAYVARYLPHLALALVVPAIIGAAVAWFDGLSAWVLALTFPLVPTFMFLVGGHARAETERQWRTLARLRARVLDAIQGLPTLKAFGAARREAQVVAAASERFREVTMRVLRVAFLSGLVLELVATLSVAVVAVEIGLRLLYDRIAFAPALAVLVLAPEFYRPLRALGAAFHAAMSGKEAAADLASIAAAGVEPVAHPAERHGRAVDVARESRLCGDSREPPHVRFDRVTFTYPGRSRPALADVTLDIGSGTTVALVGASGAGKSTLAHVLLGFLQPQSGLVLAGGQSLDRIDPDSWRSQVAWVPQRPYLFTGTVFDNLLLARPGASAADAVRALELANAGDFLSELPRGLDTPVGDRGERLSGGQAQRLALARAFLKDAPLLVLDEPTAHLDPEHDSDVREALRRLRAGRTVLLIAHHLQTAREADRVAVMDGGRVMDAGWPGMLLAGDAACPSLLVQGRTA